MAPSEPEPERRRLPSLAEWLGGAKQHPLQVGYFPLTYPFVPEWARPPVKARVEAPEVPVDAASEWRRIRDEEVSRRGTVLPTWIGTECFE